LKQQPPEGGSARGRQPLGGAMALSKTSKSKAGAKDEQNELVSLILNFKLKIE